MARRRRRYCTVFSGGPKACYPNYVQAKYNADLMAAKHPSMLFEVFKCSACRAWHVGKPKERQ